MAWDLADLNGTMISLFLFGEAAIYYANETQPSVFALLNPEIIAQVRRDMLTLTPTLLIDWYSIIGHEHSTDG